MKSKHVSSCYYKLLAVKGELCAAGCLGVGVVQPQALHSTTAGATAKSEWGKAAALRGESATTE